MYVRFIWNSSYSLTHVKIHIIFIDNICKNNTDLIDKGRLIPNSGLTSSRLASFVSCGFSLLLFSVFEDDGFAVNIDSKADICPFFDFGPGFCSFEAQERKVVMKLIHVHVHDCTVCGGSVLTTDR